MTDADRPPVIVVIDDHELSRLALATLLAEVGYVVHAASSGAEGLQSIERHRPDAVVTDIDMPDLDGVEVAKRSREAFPDTPVIAVTGLVRPPDAAHFYRVLRKPVAPRMLLETVRRAIGPGT